jgi:hypothetical protein
VAAVRWSRAGCYNGTNLRRSWYSAGANGGGDAQEEHGVRSVESRKASNPVAFGIIGLVAVFVTIFLVVFKGVTL